MAKTNEGGTGGKKKATSLQSKLTLQSGLGYTITGPAPVGQQTTPNIAPIVQPFVAPGLVMGAGGYGTAPTGAVRTAPAPPYPAVSGFGYTLYGVPTMGGAGPGYTPLSAAYNPMLAAGPGYLSPPLPTVTQQPDIYSPNLYSPNLYPQQPTLAQQMASVYAANPRLRALGGTPGTLRPPTAFEYLYARSGLGQGLAVSGMGYAMTHGATVPTPWEIRMRKNYGQAAGGTLAPTEVKDRTQVAGGTLAPTLPPLVVAKSPSYTPRRSGTGFGGSYAPGQGYAYGQGLTNWRIGH